MQGFWFVFSVLPFSEKKKKVLNESQDIKDTAQLLFWVCFVSKYFWIYKEMLSVHSLKYQTHAIGIFQYLMFVKEKFWLDNKKINF